MQPLNGKMTRTLIASISIFVTGTSWAQQHGQHDGHAEHAETKNEARIGDAYPLTVDVVSGASLTEMKQPLVVLHRGRELRFASQQGVDTFKARPGNYLKKADALIIKQQMKIYPLQTCPVSTGKLGGMGDPIDLVYGNRLVRFCCSRCVSRFKKNSEKYLAELDQAVIKAQKADYQFQTCVVSGDEFGGDMGEPIEMVVGNRFLKLCCKGCIKMFEKNPAKFLAKFADSPEENHGGMKGNNHEGHDH